MLGNNPCISASAFEGHIRQQHFKVIKTALIKLVGGTKYNRSFFSISNKISWPATVF